MTIFNKEKGGKRAC